MKQMNCTMEELQAVLRTRYVWNEMLKDPKLTKGDIILDLRLKGLIESDPMHYCFLCPQWKDTFVSTEYRHGVALKCTGCPLSKKSEYWCECRDQPYRRWLSTNTNPFDDDPETDVKGAISDLIAQLDVWLADCGYLISRDDVDCFKIDLSRYEYMQTSEEVTIKKNKYKIVGRGYDRPVLIITDDMEDKHEDE
jgi:hypothetical protein